MSITFLILQSCSSSDSNSTASNGKLKKIHTIDSSGDNFWTNFSYDSNERLIKISEGNESGSYAFQSIIFTRNSSGKIVNTFTLFNVSGNPQQINKAYTLDSDQNYLTCSLTYTPLTSNSTGEIYVCLGNKISQVNYSDGRKKKYTYDTNGNLKKIDEPNGSSVWETYANYTFDNRANPLQIEDAHIGYLRCGNNNITVEQTVDMTIIHQYNYNSNNTPSTESYTRSYTNSSQITTGSREYFY